MQEVTAPTTEEKVESTPEATPEATPEVKAEPTPTTEGEAPVTEETAEATAEATQEPESLTSILSGFESDDSPHREEFTNWKTEQRGRGWAEARESFTEEFSRQTERQDNLTRLYEGATQSYKTTLGRLEKALSQGQVDQDALNTVFQDPNFVRATEAIGKAAQDSALDQGRQEGRGIGALAASEGFVTIGAKVLGRQALAQEFIPKIQSARTQEDATRMIEGFVNKVKDIGYQQGLTDGKSDTSHTDDLAKRKDQKPAQNVGSAGATRDDNARLMDPTTPVAELIEIRNRQQAG